MAGPGILTVEFAVRPEGEHLINRWYDEEHISDRLRIDGFNSVRRFRSVRGDLRHLTVWEVDDAAWPFTEEYRSIPMDSWSSIIGPFRTRSTRTGWVEVPTGVTRKVDDAAAPGRRGVRSVIMRIPGEHQDDFHRWYQTEHIPDLMRRPEYLGIRRFRSLDGTTHLAMWELVDVELHHRPTFTPSPPSEWGARVAAYRLSVERHSWEEIDTPLTSGWDGRQEESGS